jgi:hypothetical protein
MSRKRILPLAAGLFLAFACNLEFTTASPAPETTLTPPATRRQPSPTRTDRPAPPAPTPTPTARRATAYPTYGADLSSIDAFFTYCPTSYQIESLLADIPITFEADPTAGSAPCSGSGGFAGLTEMQRRAYLSIMVMQHISFDAPLPWTTRSLYQWLADSIDGIRFRSDIENSYCCDPANVINIKVADNSYLVLTGRWIDPSMGGGLMDTMVLYVHEARHNEGYGHTCGSSDNTISELGAWGVQYYLLQWLAQHANPVFFRAPGGTPDAYRRIALDQMLAVRGERFCGEPTLTPGASPTLAG